jgi:hypothetical protein
MHGTAHEAVFIYCECAVTKQIGLPGGEKTPMYIIKILLEKFFQQCQDKFLTLLK